MASTCGSVVVRQPGDPLPRMVLDGALQALFVGHRCAECRIWWHDMPLKKFPTRPMVEPRV